MDENKTPKLINFPFQRMYRLPYIVFFNKVLCTILLIVCISGISISVYSQNHAKKQITTLVIDPGHGGKDPGAIGKNAYEKDVVLRIALKLGDYINKYLPDVKVVYTRKTDVYIPLIERAEIANKNQADLFISIHTNSNKNTTPRGAETYAMGYSRAEENLDVARKENSVILYEDDYANKYKGYDPNSAESYIIFSLVQNTFLQQSLNFASQVQDQFSRKAQLFNRGVKQAGFLVLWKTTMPGVLIETGFISNTEEEKYLISAKGQEIIASAMFRAFRDYKNQIENRSVYAKDLPDIDSAEAPNDILPADTNLPISTVDSIDIKDSQLSEKVEFYVQISSSQKHKSLKSSFFKGFTNVEEIYSGNTYKYIVGKKNSYKEILEYSKIVKNYFPDAFVVAISDGKIIPLKEVLKEIKN